MTEIQQRVRAVHPFPARMAPEIASEAMSELKPRSTVVDPLCGSGVVLRVAVELGHKAIGFDVDPLAVLMSKVWTTPLDTADLLDRGGATIKKARAIRPEDVLLPWMDADDETERFVDFWFSLHQKEQLRKLAYFVAYGTGSMDHVLQLAISKTIVTKKVGASLAWDISHSRPHRVKSENDYDVFRGFESAVSSIATEVGRLPRASDTKVEIGDAKDVATLPDEHADIVITSPPYFNAIDYMRGHRLALVWLGYRVMQLRRIRSSSVGSEQGIGEERLRGMGLTNLIPSDLERATQARLRRYVLDMAKIIGEIRRILKPNARAVMVVASSNIRGREIDSPGLIACIGELFGLQQVSCVQREIPSNRRYLPPPSSTMQESLGKRMRTESVLTFEKRANVVAGGLLSEFRSQGRPS